MVTVHEQGTAAGLPASDGHAAEKLGVAGEGQAGHGTGQGLCLHCPCPTRPGTDGGGDGVVAWPWMVLQLGHGVEEGVVAWHTRLRELWGKGRLAQCMPV